MKNREYDYSFGDDTDIIKEITTESYPMCECLKNVINALIHNNVLPLPVDYRPEYIIHCGQHDRRIDLHTALLYYGKIQNW